MNSPSSTLRAVVGASVAAALLSLAACGPAALPEEPPLKGARIGGPFTLTGGNGQPVSDSDFAGQYRIVYFGYSFCPDVCPVDLNWLMLGLKQFERQNPEAAARIQPIFITVDPARDTPAVIGSYVTKFHPRLIGLTGSEPQIRAAADAFVVQYSRQEGSAPDAYLMSHTNNAYLLGPDGAPLALLPVDNIATDGINEGTPDMVSAELARWVR